MSHLWVALILWGMLAVSLVLTFAGFSLRSWKVLWAAAALSILFTLAAILSIGPLTLLLVALQLAGAVAFRWSVGARGWLALLGSAGLIWLLAVPVQLAFGPAPLLLLLVPVGILAAIAATMFGPPSRHRSRLSA